MENVRFQAGATAEGKKYSRFFKSNTATVSDISDAEAIAKAMKDLLKRFQPSFEAVGEALPGFVEYGTTEE